tara:strand:+ start:383 stop:634 length:252 start_codon:yes stop_codon:yes gene_type:complete
VPPNAKDGDYNIANPSQMIKKNCQQKRTLRLIPHQTTTSRTDRHDPFLTDALAELHVTLGVPKLCQLGIFDISDDVIVIIATW